MSDTSKITSFFYENEELLKNFFPGINLKFLIETYQDCETNESLDGFFKKLRKGIPLQYISGKAYFYKSLFHVNKDVLIPRSETEILVEKAVELLDKIKKEKGPRIIDVGTGSGAIILSIMQDFDGELEAFATDISEEALTVASMNYNNLKDSISKTSNLNLICTDRLNDIDKKFDLIVSNPPYIKENGDRELVHDKVVEFEPHLALFLKDIEYDKWFEDFFKQVLNQLLAGGTFIMEGHEDHLDSLKHLALELGFVNVELIKDYTDRNRFLIGKKD